MPINQLTLNDFDYDLPDNRIAAHPLAQRDQSKLLVYREGDIEHHGFSNLAEQLPKNSLLIFNNTKVIPARIIVYKETGAKIEIFLLSPEHPTEVSRAMQAQNNGAWKCLIGNKKRWHEGEILTVTLPGDIVVTISWGNRDDNIVDMKWTQKVPFATLLELWGKVPLPPYIKRDAIEDDKDRYQTVYAEHHGAVAAPTAGLHFTDPVLEQLEGRGHAQDFVTLHVGAGTFKPVTVDHVIEHDMHAEPFEISRDLLKTICDHDGPVIPVGTTAMRVLESLYWLGVQAINGIYNQHAPFVAKLEPYRQKKTWDCHTVFSQLTDVMGERLTANTEIMIMPSYNFKVCDGLITNFHQPKSTLLMLIAAFTGGDEWKKIYDQALKNDYRFLSYGDSSLLLPKKD